jgi:hypothetical protein
VRRALIKEGIEADDKEEPIQDKERKDVDYSKLLSGFIPSKAFFGVALFFIVRINLSSTSSCLQYDSRYHSQNDSNACEGSLID